MPSPPAKSDEVEAQLERICESAEFSRSPQMTRLLRFLVDYTQDPADRRLNERLIGEKVFDRRLPDYDPKLDPIVRTEARRLRQKLDSYYERAGRNDPIRISIPKGTYSPQLKYLREAAAEMAVVSEPSAVLSTVETQRGVWLRLSPSLIIALAVCLVFGFVSYRFFTRPQSIRAETSYEIVPFANEIGQEFAPAVSPDGRRIAYVWDGNADNFDIYIQSVEGAARYRLTSDAAPDLYPSWSPDGKWIAFLRGTAEGTELIIKPSDGGPERTVTQIRTESSNWSTDLGPRIGNAGPAWSSDGKHLVVSDWCGPGRGFGLYLVSADTFERKILTSPQAVVRDLYPRISPDGKTLAFVRYSTHGVGEIYTQPLVVGNPVENLKPAQVTFDQRMIRGMAWTPDSKGLVFGSNRAGNYGLWMIRRLGDTPVPLPTNTSFAGDPAISVEAGWLAFVAESQNWTIWRARVGGGEVASPERFISSSGRNHTPRYSPNGEKVAFVSDRSGSWEVWVCDQAGQNAKQLTHFNGPWLGGLNWSPDGKHLVFDGRIKKHSNVFIMNSDGGIPEPLEKDEYENRMPGFSRDGRFIYFNSNRSGIVAVWKKPASGGEAKPVSGVDAFQSMESPVTAELYFDSSNAGIWKSLSDGSSPFAIPALASVSPRLNWTVSKRGIYFAGGGSAPTNFWLYRFSDTKASVIGKADKPFVLDTPSLSVSPDEQRILYAQQEHTSSDIQIRRTPVHGIK